MEKEEGTFSAEQVVAPGRTLQSMQFPSPVYFARWIDDRHAIIGAGGGGRRFGMSNLLALIAVDTTPRPGAVDSPGESVWRFVAAVDLDTNIPWCASKFLLCEDDAARARGVVGYVAVSHVKCFSLIEVSHAGALSMRTVACVPVPSDTRNPDKKPVAIVQGAIAVAHDENGIWLFSLSSLTSSCGGDVVTNAEPIAKWVLPARVNDLDANRFFVPKRDAKAAATRPLRLHSNYLLLAALVQDKTLRFATMKLRDGAPHGDGLVEASVLTGKDCRIPFSLMRSSMRLVQLFGMENIPSAEADAAWRRARRLHREKGLRGAMPIASVVLVVYDLAGNRSHILSARIASTAAEGAAPGDAESAAAPPPPAASLSARRHLALQVRFATQPSILAADGVTSVSPCHSGHTEALTGGTEGAGTAIPSRWLAATVEGSIIFVAHDSKGAFQTLDVRPAKNKRIAARFPALHREPISCVAVSRCNDVLTTDIAQNVSVSTLPYGEPVSVLTSSGENSGAARKPTSPSEVPRGTTTDLQVEKMSVQSKYEFLSLFESKTNSESFASQCVRLLSPRLLLLVALLIVPLVAILSDVIL